MTISCYFLTGFIILSLVFSSVAPISKTEFRLCCQVGTKSENCTSYSEHRDLIGVACCGSHVYNTSSQLCCDENVHNRDRGGVMAHSCCDTQPLRLDQTCCGGVIHNIIGGDCCGKDVYFQKDTTFLCCDRTLSVKSTPDDICCGNATYDGGVQQICCGNSVFDSTEFNSCCQLNNGTSSRPYHSSTHVCCDGPLEKASTVRACCYLRRENGKFIDTQYDKTKQCCKYPYDKIYSMGKNKNC
ncbi:Galaxin-like repeats domain-containing protein [Caenorhabditis elegans]|uniref:Galaxin-like n=1 Tax=Caenorhabditis elegans TaxID=6239 RepID=O61785_CAEEL|nr:Galaxin-like [Caenorhabditis elegans]CCD65175.1 Galaxin-like [Caenorhabditis elegans]|eukprot:NP_491312.2 Uncharacterized protein CELE_R12E2.8 [Caenorhabditis elegans]